ncbi:MAG TPA: phage portal protein [Vicinamibacteria bacterium]|nr:phage portal protein [Vicinamibacteria bacterium]
MSTYTTETGLVVTDRRHSRSDPRSWPDNENVQPPPPTGVGPTTSEGFGNEHVLYPEVLGTPPVQAWSGWPVEWSTPNWGDAAGGLAGIINRVSTVFGAIDLNSSILSTMPPYRVQGATVVEPLGWMRNPQPEVYTGWTEAMKQVVISYFNGEVFIWATSRYADGTVRSWVVLNPMWVAVDLEGQVRSYSRGGIDITPDVLHIRYSSWPGDPHGHGPLEALAYNLFGAAALERYQAGLATRGGIPWGVLTAPGNLSNEQATLLRDRFVAARLSAMGAPAVMSGGVTLAPFTITPKDMALIELRQFDEARIATLLRCPPTLLGLPTGEGSLVYQNVTAIYDFHWRAHLRPVAATIMEAFSQWSLPSTQNVELNRDEYVRPAFAERVAGYSTLFNIVDETGARAITVEEIRAAERLNGVGAELAVAR